MKRAGLTAALLIAATTVAAAANVRLAASPSAAHCGGALWRLKTLSDAGRTSVRLTPASTTIAAITGRPFPQPLPTKRRTSFQRQTWEVVAQLTTFRLEAGGIRLVLVDSNSFMNAVIPTPACLSARTRAREQIAQVWKQFGADCARDVGFDGDAIRSSGLQLAQRTLCRGFIGTIADGDARAILR